eukprot:GHVN01066752.1.p1 GENE.GHVN01066752.1~~GHVN01066752.1.p1  ORF type:complete len:907 (+),score=132.35 GHVN01066752.1:3539-6259(+)
MGFPMIAWLGIQALVWSVQPTSAAVYGIDYGAEFFKVAVVSPGKPFEILLNAQSKRKTPSSVFFGPDTRLFGDEAAGRATRAPESIISMPRLLLGMMVNGTRNEATLQRQFHPYELVPDTDRGTYGVKIGNSTLSAEEVNAHLLAHIRKMAMGISENPKETLKMAKSSKQQVVDCVITVPAQFTQRQRRALLDAAEIAGLHVLQLVSETHAAAIYMAATKEIENVDPPKTLYTLFYNMGATSTEACLISFTPRNTTKTRPPQDVNIHGCEGVPFGGHMGEVAIAEYMIKQFHEKHGIDVSENLRVMKRVLIQSERTKVTLSANKDASFTMEQMTREKDFSTSLNRDQFERLIQEPILNQLEKPTVGAFNKANLTKDVIGSVELLGGGWRIPKVQALLKEQLQPLDLGQHLNGDEAMALGASFIAANASTSFRVREVGFAEGSYYTYKLEIKNKEDGDEPYFKSLELIKAGGKLHGAKRVSVNVRRDLEITLFEEKMEIATFEVGGIAVQAGDKYKGWDTPKVTMTFKVDTRGLVYLEKATATWEEALPTDATTTTTASTPEEASETTTVAPDGTPQNKTAEETDAQKAEVDQVKKHVIVLRVESAFTNPPPLKDIEKQAAIDRLKSLELRDASLKLRAEKRNSLEATVYAMRDHLERAIVKDVSTEGSRQAIGSKLSEVEEWLYEDGEDAEIAALQNKTDEIKQLTDKLLERADEAEYRPKLREVVKKTSEMARSEVESLNATRPWIPKEKLEAALNATNEFEQWFAKMDEEQSLLPKTEDPVLTRDQTAKRAADTVKYVDALRKMKKPKEVKPKKQKSANATDTDGAENTSATTSAESAAADTLGSVPAEVEQPREGGDDDPDAPELAKTSEATEPTPKSGNEESAVATEEKPEPTPSTGEKEEL